MGKEFENLVYRLVKDFTFFLKRRPDGNYETRFTSWRGQTDEDISPDDSI